MKLRTAAEILASIDAARNSGEKLFVYYRPPQLTPETHQVFTARPSRRGEVRIRVVPGVWLYIDLRYADFYSKEVNP